MFRRKNHELEPVIDVDFAQKQYKALRDAEIASFTPEELELFNRLSNRLSQAVGSAATEEIVATLPSVEA